MAAARTAVAERDRHLADADRQLARILSEAHAIAGRAVRRLDDLTAQIEAATIRQDIETPLQGREFAHFLIVRQREAMVILAEARAGVDAATAALRQLADSYRTPSAS